MLLERPNYDVAGLQQAAGRWRSEETSSPTAKWGSVVRAGTWTRRVFFLLPARFGTVLRTKHLFILVSEPIAGRSFKAFRQSIATRMKSVATNMLVLCANDDPEPRNCWLARAVNPPWQRAFTHTLGGLDANADDDTSRMFANGGTWFVEVQWYVLDPQRRRSYLEKHVAKRQSGPNWSGAG
eukprot:INCI13467.21.p1 GENE.INCI13467.21~~INCI13467.21.p1  ORF type:complete len:182 (-),score=18.45 INCI13467.21:158-703(-)